jgi:cytochrome c oxidase subunit 2
MASGAERRTCFVRWVAVLLAGCGARGASPIEVRILADDRSWSASYLPTGAPTGREVHVPVGAEVSLTLASANFVAIFALPALGLRDVAAPGLPGSFHFRADRAGAYELTGDELCGLPHGDEARGRLVVEDPAAFRSWVASRRAAR